MSAFLARRGFGYEAIGDAVRRVWREQHQAEDSLPDGEQAQASSRTEYTNFDNEETP